MKNKIVLTIATLFVTSSAFAEIAIYIYDGANFNVVASSDVEAKCGKNFIFRSELKNEAPKYLGKEIIKATFTGKLSPSFSDAVSAVKASKNKCIWVSPDEAKELK